MIRISKSLLLILTITGILLPGLAFSQSYTIDCKATLKAWEKDPRMTEYLRTHNCSCPPSNIGSPICTTKSSSQPPAMPYGGGMSSKQQTQMMMFQSMFQPLLNSVFDFSNLFGPPDTSRQDAFIRQQQEELKRQQEIKRQALERWLALQTEAETSRLKEKAEKERRGQEILSQTSLSGSGGLKMESIGGGRLEPFSWNVPQSFAPVPSGQYDTSRFTEMERLLCAAYFSKMAASSVDMEGVRFYTSQMDHVMQGLPTSIECKPPKELASTMDMKRAAELNRRYTEESKLYRQVVPKIEKFSEIETKLEEVKVKKEEASKKIEEVDKQIEEIKSRSQTVDTPEKKAEVDALLAQAMALKAEAEKEYREAVESEERLNKEKQDMENELNEMKNKMQAGGQR
ncbi:MAG: hypothetical protein HXY46_08570 [Syntrophaceae bacterium]|nr:hypothetical protein [Syntrophaceae bacterium]